MNQVITGPSQLSNSSSSGSINSITFFSSFNSSISTKFSLLNNNNSRYDSGYFHKSNYLSDFEDSISPQTMAAMSRIQRRKQNKQQQQASSSTDRLSVTLHTSDSDFNKKARRRRPEFDRQKSISRWMADTLSSKCGQIRRSLSSHETLMSLSKGSLHRRSEHTDKAKKNASFRFFARSDTSGSMHKPVRKPSSGPDGLMKDVLMALGSPDSTHKTQKGSTLSLDVGGLGSPDDLDIEDSDTDNEEDEFGGSTDFTSAEFKAQPPLLSGRTRWDSSSPSREVDEKHHPSKDSPPKNGCNSNSRRSSRTMPILPPPPFTPVKKSLGKVDGEEMLNSSLAPLAAAAIAIATDTMGEEIEEEEGLLNDINNNSIRVMNHRSDHTDGAMASSVCTWNDSISTDGVSLLSASNASIPYWTNRSTSSLGPLGSALERLNEEDAQERRRNSNNKDMSYKSSADETYESGYTFHHDADDSPAPSTTRPRFPQVKSSSEHTRMLAPLVEPPLTPLRDASVVPPPMPRRSVSNHDCDSESESVPMASPADRLKYLLNHSEKRYGRRSSMPNGSCGVDGGSDHSNSMSMRRASLDSSSHHVRTSTQRRRCSLDSSTNHSRLRQMRRNSMDSSTHSSSHREGSENNGGIPYPPSLDDSDNLRMHTMPTPPMSRFTRTSPAIGGAQRKRMNNNYNIPSNPSFEG